MLLRLLIRFAACDAVMERAHPSHQERVPGSGIRTLQLENTPDDERNKGRRDVVGEHGQANNFRESPCTSSILLS